MEPDDLVVLDNFKSWKVDALKEYLRKRGLSVTGNKELLVGSYGQHKRVQCTRTQHVD